MTACFHRDHSRLMAPRRTCQTDESRPRTTPFQHGQLLSQHEVFKDEILAVAEDSKERPECQPKHAEHNRSYNRILAAAAGYVIGFKVGQSCGEPQHKNSASPTAPRDDR
jgi:hypothetical protein